jgi:hypothetical protein
MIEDLFQWGLGFITMISCSYFVERKNWSLATYYGLATIGLFLLATS